jgi:hypothetical protein
MKIGPVNASDLKRIACDELDRWGRDDSALDVTHRVERLIDYRQLLHFHKQLFRRMRRVPVFTLIRNNVRSYSGRKLLRSDDWHS